MTVEEAIALRDAHYGRRIVVGHDQTSTNRRPDVDDRIYADRCVLCRHMGWPCPTFKALDKLVELLSPPAEVEVRGAAHFSVYPPTNEGGWGYVSIESFKDRSLLLTERSADGTRHNRIIVPMPLAPGVAWALQEVVRDRTA